MHKVKISERARRSLEVSVAESFKAQVSRQLRPYSAALTGRKPSGDDDS